MKKKKKIQYKVLPDAELTAEEDAQVLEMIEQAERDIDDMRVSFRWGLKQLDLVKDAAKVMGVPYQTFIKLAVFERAAAVLNSVKSIDKTNGSPNRRKPKRT